MSAMPDPAAPAPDQGGEVPQRPADIDNEVESARLQQLYARTPAALLGGVFFAPLLAVMLASEGWATAAWAWCLSKWAVQALRWWDTRRFDADAQRQQRLAQWTRRHQAGTLLDGVGWGAVGILFVPSGNLLLDGVLVASLVGVASIGVQTLSSYTRQASAFMATVLLPMMVYHLWLGGTASWLLSGGLLIFMVVSAVEGGRNQVSFVASLRLRFENAAIAEERRQALQLAQHASAAKSRFLAVVSHELRTPLNGILGMTQLLAEDGLSPPAYERLLVVKKSAQHLQGLIEDLLDLSRAEAGRLQLKEQPTALAPLVRDVTDLLAPVAQAKGLQLGVEGLDGLPAAALLDGPRVRQVLHNLLGNAIKFTQDGNVQLRVFLRGQTLHFEVTDSGDGVPEGWHERVFEAFEQAVADGDARRAGSGLGLAIARQIAQAMAGNVSCRSQPGQGATFTFTARYVPAVLPEVVVSPWQVEPVRLAGKVLVVEDNAVNLMVARAMLEGFGLDVSEATGGQHALDLLATEPVDLVLMDCQMPGLDGLETTRRWRAHEAHAGLTRLPVLALTANATVQDRARCLAAGMDAHLTKPIDRRTLAEVLGQYLKGQNHSADNPAPCASSEPTAPPPSMPPAVP
jgi:two-component system, sensor histidine kinase